jgi:hypothetical protein
VTVVVDRSVFARLVGHYPERDTLLFEVSGDFVQQADGNDWSEPVRFRFVRREGARVEIEFQIIDLTAVDENAL